MSAIPSTHYPLIESFLGPGAVPIGPQGLEAMLAVPPGERSPAVVFAGLQQRLAFLAAHPRGDSSEAQIVRLCLQAAAAQLLSPAPRPVLQPAAATFIPARAAEPAAGRRDSSSPEEVPEAAAHPASTSVLPAPVTTSLAATHPIPHTPNPLPLEPLDNGGSNGKPVHLPAPPRPQSATMQSSSATAGSDPLVREAARLVAIEGGVTPTVIKHVAMLAMARGLPAAAAQAIIEQLAGARPASATVSAAPLQSSATPAAARQVAAAASKSPVPNRHSPAVPNPSLFEPDPDEEDPGTRLLKIAALIAGGIFIASIALIVGGVVLLSNVPAKPVTPAPVDTAIQPPPAAPTASKPDPADENLGQIPDAGAVVRLMHRAAEAANTDRADAIARFEKAAPILAAWWPRLDMGQRAATVNEVIDIALRVCADPDFADRFVAALAGGSEPLAGKAPLPADRIFTATWSVGMLARLSSEQNLPSRARLRVQSAAARALSGARLPSIPSFNAGATLALRAMPLRILGEGASADPAAAVAAFEKWEQAVQSLFGASRPEQIVAETMIVDALDRLLTSAPEPDENRAVFDVISSVAGRLRWRDGDPSRRKLLAWFDDRRVSNADLATLTAAIVSRSAAEGVDSTMVLSRSAGGEQRAELREAYANAWGLVPAPGGGMAQNWAQVARDELLHNEPDDAAESLHAAIVFARLNEAAWRRHRGDMQGAADVLVNKVAPIRRSGLPPLASYVIVSNAARPDGSWALRFLSSDKSLPPRLDRLRELEAYFPTIGPIDADVLAEVALLGPGELRPAAIKLVPSFGSSPSMCNSILKFLSRAPRSPALAKAILDLTGRSAGPWNSDRWRLLARRSVAERLLEILAADKATSGVDHAAALLADAYQASAAMPVSEAEVADEEGGKLARDAGAAMFTQLHDMAVRAAPNDAAPMPLDRIDQRHSARLAVSRGLVQQFAADQLGCAELMAFIVSAERPARAPEVAAVLEAAHARHRDALDVRLQIKVAEAAMLRLWFIRLGEPAP